MTYFRFFLFSLFLLLAPAAAQEAETTDFTAGIDYLVLDPPQPVRARAGKIEVIEFFNYSCPHCFRFQRPLAQWADDSDLADVQIIKQPVTFRRYNGLFAQIHYTLAALGIADEFDHKLYNAIHVKRKLINSPGRFLDWLADEGIDRDRAEAAFESFAVKLNTDRAREFPTLYGVDSTPQFAVAGKYVLSPSLSGSPERLLRIVSHLIEQERAAQ